VLYDKLEGPPEPGSVMEALCILVQMRREMTELYRVHTVVQAVLTTVHPESKDTGDNVREAFNNFKGSLMPFVKHAIKEEQERVMRALRDEVKRGPLMIKPLDPEKISSRLLNKVKRELNRPTPLRKRPR
jgi:hypothetical protein